MVAFTKKAVAPAKRVCFCLKEAREAKGIKLNALSERMHISRPYLEALEECRFSDLPFAPIYQKHLIKSYLEALQIDPIPYLKQFSEEETPVTLSLHGVTKKTSFSFISLPLVLRFAGIVVMIGICASYLGLQVKHIVEPPKLTIYTPTHGTITNSGSLTVTGKTEPEVAIAINGTSVRQKENGEFTVELDLPVGVNTLQISAKKKHGKSTTETRHVIVRDVQQFTLTSDPVIKDRL
ncbi:MAG TPA: helix-turn-helix domain-containing protein [Candidatus Kapabacteria bacterium]|nr:helix-turn-helix domain-containing protein [Candidatus Kapabacteria bacterium]